MTDRATAADAFVEGERRYASSRHRLRHFAAFRTLGPGRSVFGLAMLALGVAWTDSVGASPALPVMAAFSVASLTGTALHFVFARAQGRLIRSMREFEYERGPTPTVPHW